MPDEPSRLNQVDLTGYFLAEINPSESDRIDDGNILESLLAEARRT
jgi:hypothetical protein